MQQVQANLSDECRHCQRVWSLLAALLAIALSLSGCWNEKVRCQQFRIEHGDIEATWKGNPGRIKCDKGYKYSGEAVKCAEHDRCNTTDGVKHCQKVMYWVPKKLPKPAHKPPTEKPLHGSEGAAAAAPPPTPPPPGPASAPAPSRMLKGAHGGGGASSAGLAIVDGKQWSMKAQRKWVKKLKCTPNVTSGVNSTREDAQKFDVSPLIRSEALSHKPADILVFAALALALLTVVVLSVRSFRRCSSDAKASVEFPEYREMTCLNTNPE